MNLLNEENFKFLVRQGTFRDIFDYIQAKLCKLKQMGQA
jgi:hypothetical protein